MKQLMLEIHQKYLQEIFKDYVSIKELQSMMNPPPARSTIINRIMRLALDAKQLDDSPSGTYIIYLPSAKKLWPERFE